MGAPQLTEQVRNRLVALIAEDRPDGERLLTRLRDFRTLEGVPACSAVVHLLARLSFRENDAEQLLSDLLAHRAEIERSLHRDPGLRVAAMDYLSNVRPLLRNPGVIEQAQLRRRGRSAITDELTELYSRRHAQITLENEVRRSARSHQPLSVLALDLDSFKSVNDLYGQPFGDLVLQMVGKVLRRSVRDADVAARVGGEEFAVILPETGRLEAYAVAERIRRSVELHFSENTIGNRAVSMTVSGGLASYPHDGEDSATLLARAEQALYQSKIQGRNRITIYHSERRLAIRYPVRQRSQVTLSESDRKAATRAVLVNVSSSGALVEPAPEAAPTGPLELTFEPSRGSGGETPLTARGHVVRVQGGEGVEGGRDESHRSGRRRLAIAFDTPLPEEKLIRGVALSGTGPAAAEDPA